MTKKILITCFLGFTTFLSASVNSYSYRLKDIGLLYGMKYLEPGRAIHLFDLHYENHHTNCTNRRKFEAK